MRKLGLAAVILVTGYFAGIYRNDPLMIMAVMEVLLAVTMFALSRFFLWSLDAQLPEGEAEALRGSVYRCPIIVTNRGRIPASRFRLRLSSGYLDEEPLREDIFGGTEKTGQRLGLDVDCEHCGLASVTAEQLKVYDYLSVFCPAKKLGRRTEIAVFPQENAAKITLDRLNAYLAGQPQGASLAPFAGGNDEIRQLREYREGDAMRHVHWNLTARMDELWVREYDSERDVPLQFEADVTELTNGDQYYEVLMALLCGLLREAACVRVWWRAGEEYLGAADVREVTGVKELLKSLYRRTGGFGALPHEPEAASSVFSLKNTEEGKVSWALDGELIWTFSEETYREELGGKIFEL